MSYAYGSYISNSDFILFYCRFMRTSFMVSLCLFFFFFFFILIIQHSNKVKVTLCTHKHTYEACYIHVHLLQRFHFYSLLSFFYPLPFVRVKGFSLILTSSATIAATRFIFVSLSFSLSSIYCFLLSHRIFSSYPT